MKTFKVYTFAHPIAGKPISICRISAYTHWACESWPGCKVYEVQSTSGAGAKAIARRLRFDEERADAAARPEEGT